MKITLFEFNNPPQRAEEHSFDLKVFVVKCSRYRIDTVNSPDDGHMVARNMQRIEINTNKKMCFSLVYLQRLY